jgi:hypothetical protein
MQDELTTSEALEIFHQNDDPQNWEFPVDFDDQAFDRFEEFYKAFERRTGLQLPHTSDFQDTSFHSIINLDGNHWLRFSNFGNLISINADESVNKELLKTIKTLAKEHGYIYIPSRYTDLPYDGKNPGVSGIKTWWARYFDWV